MASHTNDMKINLARRKVMMAILCFVLLLTGVLAYGVYWLFYDWSRFKQEFIAEAASPDGTYTVRAYRSNEGVTVSYAILGELIFNKENRKSRKIYWQYREEKAVIEWVDDDTVKINNIQLEVPDEVFDYRSGIKSFIEFFIKKEKINEETECGIWHKVCRRPY